MLADGTTTLWQAVSPMTADAILRDNGQVLHPSCQGDAFALLKLNPELARQMAESVWAQRYGAAAVVEIIVASLALASYPMESVAYEYHREFRIPTSSLPLLSGALVRPARVVQQLSPRAGVEDHWALAG